MAFSKESLVATEPERNHLRSTSAPAAAVAWPDGKTSAACLSFDVDAESAVLSIDTRAANRMGPMSHQAYGPLVGVPRILEILERHRIRSTFFVPGYTADRYPDTVRAIRDGGHEIAHHGYLHEDTTNLSRDAEASMLDRGLEAILSATGITPVGYRAPMWEINYHTPALLTERGFQYDSSLMDSDHPYLLAVEGAVGGTTLVEIPVSWALDDWEQYAYLPGLIGSGLIESPSKALEMWMLELEALHQIGGVFSLTCHPFLSGRPSRASALEQLVRRMEEIPGLWIASLEEIAAHVRNLDLEPRRVTKPELPGENPGPESD